jgi:hypothetical protein
MVEKLEDQATDLDKQQLESLFMLCNRLSNVLACQVQEQRSNATPLFSRRYSISSGMPSSNYIHNPIHSEVLRQIIPFLSAKEMGRLFLLTSRQLISVLGSDYIWKEISAKFWPDFPIKQSLPATIIKPGYYRWYFKKRNQRINFQSGNLKSLPKPKLDPDTMTACVDIYNEMNELVCTRTIDSTQEEINQFVFTGTVTIKLESSIRVGELQKQKCHCWNLPKSYPGWSAHLSLFLQGTESRPPKAFTLLHTKFSVWKGWSENGELTFIQRERTKGLQLTDRGSYIQHRIVSRNTYSNWRNYLGLQTKVVLLCDKVSGNKKEYQNFGFTQVRIEAIRLHQSSAGNIRHSLFRKDKGWSEHGVELLHLLEELI